MKLLYFGAVSATVVAIVVLNHTHKLSASSMCLSTNSPSLEAFGHSSTEAVYNFIEAKIDHSFN